MLIDCQADMVNSQTKRAFFHYTCILFGGVLDIIIKRNRNETVSKSSILYVDDLTPFIPPYSSANVAPAISTG